MRTPDDKKIAFTFVSHPTKNLDWRWKAVLEFAPGSDENSNLPITVTTDKGEPIEKAVFEFAGQQLEVRDGKTSISYKDFIKGKSSVPLWLYRKGLPPVPAGLTFA